MSTSTDHQHSRCGSCGQPVGHWAVDKLTGLPDRWGWDDQAHRRWDQARQSGQTMALLMIDLDRFKQINDDIGHLAGDAVLRAVADVLRAATGESDLLGRYGGHGGDEFLVLLPMTSLDGAVAAATRIRDGIRAMQVQARTADHTGVTISGQTASIGIAAHTPLHPFDLLEDLLRDADAALLQAKRRGRDQLRVSRPTASPPAPRREREWPSEPEVRLSGLPS